MDIKIDYELLVQLCKEKEEWGRKIILHKAYIYDDVLNPGDSYIISSYKNIAWPDFVLSLDVYLPRLREKIAKEREIKLNKLISL
jgi:hypothetical protein